MKRDPSQNPKGQKVVNWCKISFLKKLLYIENKVTYNWLEITLIKEYNNNSEVGCMYKISLVEQFKITVQYK